MIQFSDICRLWLHVLAECFRNWTNYFTRVQRQFATESLRICMVMRRARFGSDSRLRTKDVAPEAIKAFRGARSPPGDRKILRSAITTYGSDFGDSRHCTGVTLKMRAIFLVYFPFLEYFFWFSFPASQVWSAFLSFSHFFAFLLFQTPT